MLVKCISFIITLFGAKRYKPLLLTLVTLIITLSGIGIVAAFNDAPHETAASTSPASESNTRETLATQTPSKQSIRPEDTTTGSDQTAGGGVSQSTSLPSTTNSTPAKPETPTQNPATAIVFNPASKEVYVHESDTYNLTVSTNDNSKVQWTVVTGNTCEVQQVNPKQSSAPASTMTFTFTTGAIVRPGSKCSMTITAKDTSRNVDLAETITLITPTP